MPAIRCPKCRIYNDPDAQRCDCGYDFPSGEMKESYLTEKERKNTGSIGIIEGIVAVIFPYIGIIWGVVLLIQGKPRGKKMLILSIVFLVIQIALRVVKRGIASY